MIVKAEKKGVWTLKKEHESAFLVTMDDGREFYANGYRVHDVETERIITTVSYQTDMEHQGYGRNNSIKMWEDNARLIVNAPEMVQTLRDFVEVFDDHLEDERQIEVFENARNILSLL